MHVHVHVHASVHVLLVYTHATVDDHNTINNPHNRDGGDYMELREPIEGIHFLHSMEIKLF